MRRSYKICNNCKDRALGGGLEIGISYLKMTPTRSIIRLQNNTNNKPWYEANYFIKSCQWIMIV